MSRTFVAVIRNTQLLLVCVFALSLVGLCATAASVSAAVMGKIQGKIVATDNGDAIGFADVLLLPADTTMKRVGGLTNADGTFLLEAAPGRYVLQIRALSYARKRIEGITIEAGKLLPYSTGLTSEALKVEEIVVEAKLKQNTENSMLQARKRATSVGDAVSAEQVRRTPDKDAAEVLRRVTGLSVSDGKYVFVRGLGERYSSTEVDGVRLASPEQNKRVVPLDLLPANLLENIVVQKTYTADRPGEFGGGDVQVRTKDFPGNRTWSLSVSQGAVEGLTFKDHQTYASSNSDLFGFGAGSRSIPGIVYDVAGSRPLINSTNPQFGFPTATLAQVARAFSNVWSTANSHTAPNASYSATYGDEFKVLGKPLGLVNSWSFQRNFSHQNEAQRFFENKSDTLYDFNVNRWKESAQLGGLSKVSFRPSPRHSFNVSGLWTHSADDEVRTYEGPDHNREESTTGGWLVHRATRLMYVERDVLSGSVEGKHDFSHLLGTSLDWKVTRSRANRLQPDRRETTYDRRYYYDGDGNLVGYWSLGSLGSREYGDLRDNGWGTTVNASIPWKIKRLGSGKTAFGYDRQTKARRNFYRRFEFTPNQNADPTLSPDSLFSPTQFDGQPGTGVVDEATLDIDNYRANQRVEAGYVSTDVPFGRMVRGTFGVRVEHGFQDVRSFDLFRPNRITAEGRLDNTDWLPSGNLTVSVTPAINMRLGASRTLSRPDLNELSPSPSLEYVGGYQVSGNPNLKRALINNYDVRFEAFPTINEVFAAGYFYKRFDQPVEQVVQGGSPPILVPRNSDHAINQGVELEARTNLGRAWKKLSRFSLNSNASFINSKVTLVKQITKLGSQEHPLQGQANYLLNVALSASVIKEKADVSVLLSSTGKRLRALGVAPLPDVYEQPSNSLDAAFNYSPTKRLRIKATGKNLLDPRIQQLQDGKEVSGYKLGRSFSIALSFGS